MCNFDYSQQAKMITIISGTNRPDSKTIQVAQQYYSYLQAAGHKVQLMSLTELDSLSRNERFEKIEAEKLIPADKFIFVLPEYNGSYPGVLKLLFDISDIKKAWYFKKAMLTGVADGRAGNLRGLDHLTNVLNYLKVNVFYFKIPISRINNELSESGEWKNADTFKNIKEQVDAFLEF